MYYDTFIEIQNITGVCFVVIHISLCHCLTGLSWQTIDEEEKTKKKKRGKN